MGLCILVIIVLALGQGSQAGKKVFCYFSSSANARGGIGKFWPENIDPFLCTHLIFAFADIAEGGRGLEPNNWNDLGRHGLYMRTHKLKEINPKLKLILAVGGWRIGSLPFLPVIETLESMEFFAGRVVTYLRHYGFDGMDMDWEFPGIRGSKAGDKAKFTELMKTIQHAFEVDAVRRRAPKLILTMAAAASQYYAEIAYEQDKIWRYVDYVLLMTYNYHGANWENITGHHSALLPHRLDKNDDRQHNFVWSVEYWLRSGIPPEKLCVGLATYGISFKLADPKLHGVRAPVLGPGSPGPHTNESGILAYYEICDALENRGWQMEWIDDQYAPYAHGDGDWVGFENQDSLVIKMNDVLKRGLGGVLVWSVEMDDFNGHCNEGKFPLLRAINNVIKPSYDSDDFPSQHQIKGPQKGHAQRKHGSEGRSENIKKSDDIIQESPKNPERIGPEKEIDRRPGGSPQIDKERKRPKGPGGRVPIGQGSNEGNGPKRDHQPKQGTGSKEGRGSRERGLGGNNEMARNKMNNTTRKVSTAITTQFPTSVTVNDSIIHDWNPWITQHPPPRDRYPNGRENPRRVIKRPKTPDSQLEQIQYNISDKNVNQTDLNFNSSGTEELRNSSGKPIGEIHFETTTTFDNFEWPEISNQTEEKVNKSAIGTERPKASIPVQTQPPPFRPDGTGRQLGEYEHSHNLPPDTPEEPRLPIETRTNGTQHIPDVHSNNSRSNNTIHVEGSQNSTSHSDAEHNIKKSEPIINNSSMNESRSPIQERGVLPSSRPETSTRSHLDEIQIPEEIPEFHEDNERSEDTGSPGDYSWYDYWDSGSDSDWSDSGYDYSYGDNSWYGYSDEWYDSHPEYYYTEPGEIQEESHAEDHTTEHTTEHPVDSHESMYGFDCNKKGLGIYKDPTSCIHFIMCVPMTIWHLGPLKMDCPHGTRFDDHLKVCNFEHKVMCDED